MTARPLASAILLALLGIAAGGCAERFLVVERESAALAVVEGEAVAAEIKGVGDMNHATVKFDGDHAYVISRDGHVSKVHVPSGRLVKSVKVGESGIGLTIGPDFVAVANYAPKQVVFLDKNLTVRSTIVTDSRNVGIKNAGSRVAFALMDKDEVWVVDAARGFEVVKKLTAVGAMPFDALLHGNTYVVGFFGENAVGLLDLAKLEYAKKPLGASGGELTLKIPHFGTWGVAGDLAFVPGVKEKKLNILDLARMSVVGEVPLPGTPVFAVVSPDWRKLAVNYSGEREHDLTIVDVPTRQVERTVTVGGRIMHLRYSDDGARLLVSSYFDNQVKIYASSDWRQVGAVTVPGPSGIFRM